MAVIGAGDDPTVADDLANYRAEYGLPSCTASDGCLRVVNEEGASSPLPAQDPGFQQSESAQVELVSAACPNCRLLVVEASGNDMADIAASVNEAAALGATIINEPITGDEVANEASAV